MTRCSGAATISNTENSKDQAVIPPFSSGGVTIWIPWATNVDEWVHHHLLLEIVNGQRWSIWQANFDDGDHVRYAKRDTFEFPGDWIGGDNGVGGKRALHVFADRLELQAAHAHIPLTPA